MTPGLVRTSKTRLRSEARRARGGFNPIRRAREYEAARADGPRSYEEVAAMFGVTRAAVCQYLVLLQRLPDHLLRKIETETDFDRLRGLSMKKLLRIARLPHPPERLEALSLSVGFR